VEVVIVGELVMDDHCNTFESFTHGFQVMLASLDGFLLQGIPQPLLASALKEPSCMVDVDEVDMDVVMSIEDKPLDLK
jgi:hypothetical protein